MTDSPSPSDRPKGPKNSTFGLFRPVLFAIGASGLAMLGLVLSHRANPDIPKPGPVAAAPEPQKSADPAPPKLPAAIPTPPAFVLVDSEPAPPITAADFKPQLDFKGFQMKPQDGPTEPDPPANEPYELTLRLEKGDTIEKMLADIDVPEAERKQVAEKLQSLLKKRKLAIGETIELQM